MANTFRLEIVTPAGVVLDEQIVHVRCPGAAGDFGVLAGHAPMMAGLTAGRLGVDFAGRTEDYVITGGYLEVHDNQAVVLAESCENRNDIDLEQAKQELEAAHRKLDAATDSVTQNEARIAVERARARVGVATFQRS